MNMYKSNKNVVILEKICFIYFYLQEVLENPCYLSQSFPPQSPPAKIDEQTDTQLPVSWSEMPQTRFPFPSNSWSTSIFKEEFVSHHNLSSYQSCDTNMIKKELNVEHTNSACTSPSYSTFYSPGSSSLLSSYHSMPVLTSQAMLCSQEKQPNDRPQISAHTIDNSAPSFTGKTFYYQNLRYNSLEKTPNLIITQPRCPSSISLSKESSNSPSPGSGKLYEGRSNQIKVQVGQKQ